jgi:hypothetical protein
MAVDLFSILFFLSSRAQALGIEQSLSKSQKHKSVRIKVTTCTAWLKFSLSTVPGSIAARSLRQVNFVTLRPRQLIFVTLEDHPQDGQKCNLVELYIDCQAI